MIFSRKNAGVQRRIQDFPKGDHGEREPKRDSAGSRGTGAEEPLVRVRGLPLKLKAFCPFSYISGQKLRI